MRERGEQFRTLDLEDERLFEDYQGEDEETARQQRADITKSLVRKNALQKRVGMQLEESSSMKRRKRSAKILSTEEEDNDKENGLKSDRISHNPRLGKVHSKYKMNFEQTLEGSMQLIELSSVEKRHEGAKESGAEGILRGTATGAWRDDRSL